MNLKYILIMGGGIIQLVAVGIHDLFITNDPQVTFFKLLYRRHTNFSMEPVAQYFNTNKIHFGQKISCSLSRTGDLVNRIYFVIDLPIIPNNLVDPRFRFAWARKLGFVLLKTVEVEIGGQSIDVQYNEWLNIWNELAETNDNRMNEQIGDVKELYEFTNGKNTRRLHVPLQFWFCRNIGLSLPIVALQYSEIKINIELENQDNCTLVGPTHSLNMNASVVHYTPGEIITQQLGSSTAMGIFIDYDVSSGKIYYVKVTDIPFQGFDQTQFSMSNVNLQDIIDTYVITGQTSKFQALPKDGAVETVSKVKTSKLIDKLIIPNCFLNVHYIYVDIDERARFIHTAHEYLIEQTQIGSYKMFQTKKFQVNLQINHPCKALYWVAQMNICKNVNDTFNYTNSILRDKNNKLLGKNLIRKNVLLLNSRQRFEEQTADYFNYIQPLFYFPKGPVEGINCYAFGVDPINYQPGGSCNMSKIDMISMVSSIDPNVFTGGSSFVKFFAQSLNILRIINGLGGLLFAN
jgi:hypothetical protein